METRWPTCPRHFCIFWEIIGRAYVNLDQDPLNMFSTIYNKISSLISIFLLSNFLIENVGFFQNLGLLRGWENPYISRTIRIKSSSNQNLFTPMPNLKLYRNKLNHLLKYPRENIIIIIIFVETLMIVKKSVERS